MTRDASIKCPHCGHEIDIEEALYAQLKVKFDMDMTQERKRYKVAMERLQQEKEALSMQQESLAKEIEQGVSKKLSQEKIKLTQTLQKELELKLKEENAMQIASLTEELTKKSKELQELNLTKANLARLQREKDELESTIKAQAQQELNQELHKAKEQLQLQLKESHEMQLKAKDEQLSQIKKQLDDAKRKAEQGSQQLQGEAQEISIEEYLEHTFKYDTIEPVAKGAYGADCIETINTPEFQNCGKICFESKNTKSFNSEWIKKLKHDMIEAKADVGVLVTASLPKDMERMGYIDGIWVCSYEEFKGSVALIRQGVIEVYKASRSQENRVDKMNLLYNYFTSNEFRLQLQSIVEGFVAMQEELNRQKRSVMASWKRQQKHIDNVLLNTTNMYGSIKGIAGNALESVAALELEYVDGEDEDE